MKPFTFLIALAGLAPAIGASAEDHPLARQSPFGTAVADGSPGAPSLELRGIMAGSDGTRYCIFDRARNASDWAAPDEAGHSFLIRSGNPDQDEATVEAEGHLLVLRLKNAKVLPARPEPVEAAPETPHAIMTRRLPGEPRAPRPNPGP